MSKFKVGDKVRVRSDLIADEKYGMLHFWGGGDMENTRGKVIVIESVYPTDEETRYMTSADFYFNDIMLEPISEHKREFIVIHRSGNVMTAERRVNREVIKSEKAMCNESDTFDFDTGAKLAFDRLMGREEPKRESLADVFEQLTGRAAPIPKTAPKPPKFYTGKVFCSGCEKGAEFAYKDLIGRVLFIDNGRATWHQLDYGFSRYASFDDFCERNRCGVWHEVKSDV